MQAEQAIVVENVTKSFKVYYDRGASLKEWIIRGKGNYQKREVLKGISFTVKKGEAVGLIGINGCGKSTTLKLLTRIIYPDSGRIQLEGRVSSLLELGAGFHPDMSGRENIYLNASIFGLTRKEIEAKVDDIIAFSELGDFIENPVRTYSSGMYMRLAFSVAISVEADILLIDEILAVGDVNFQAKCYEKLNEIKASGTTIIIVSHSLSQIEQICDRTIWLENGLIREDGISKFVHERYLASMENTRLNKTKEEKKEVSEWSTDSVRSGNGNIQFTKVELRNSDQQHSMLFQTGDKMIIHMEYEGQENLEVMFAVGICRDDGVFCYGTNTLTELEQMIKSRSAGVIEMEIPELTLLSGKYILDIAVRTKDKTTLDKIHHVH